MVSEPPTSAFSEIRLVLTSSGLAEAYKAWCQDEATTTLTVATDIPVVANLSLSVKIIHGDFPILDHHFRILVGEILIVNRTQQAQVNWPDEDIRRISWEVISSTISVFGSLLLFQGCNRRILRPWPTGFGHKLRTETPQKTVENRNRES